MTTEVTTTSRATRALEIGRDWLASRRHQTIAAVVLYAAIAIGYFGLHVLPNLGQECVCEPGPSDPAGYMWSLAWWPHALLHGMNPFITNAVFAPDRIDLGGVGFLIPGYAILAAPITLLFGPVVSYTLLVLVSPVLAAFFAFLLCRYVSGSFSGGLFGGYLYGFSAFMLGHMLGHLSLILIFPIPAAVHLALLKIDGRISDRRLITLMTLTLVALVSASSELAFTFVLLSAVALAVSFALAPAYRERLIAALKPMFAAGVVAAVIVSPLIYYGLKGNVTTGFEGNGDLYAGDALGFLVPTTLIRLGRTYFAAVSARFTSGDAAEGGIYVGLPVALILARYTITRWRLPATRILLCMLAVVVVLALGSHLHLAGYPTIPLPWQWLDRSVLAQLVPARFGVYLFLIVAMIAAMWLGHERAGRWAIAKWVVVAVAIAFVVPNIGSGFWRSSPPNPTFFTTQQYRTVLRRNETVLVVPFGYLGFSMLWQAETGFWFRMAGGYLWRVAAPDYVRDPLLPALYERANPDPALLHGFLVLRNVGAVVLGPGAPPSWPAALAALGLKPISLGGVEIYRTSD